MFGREQEQAKYFVSRKSKLLGPYPMDELKSLLRGGTLASTDTAWTQGMLKWLPLVEVAGGKIIIAPSKTVLPPPAASKSRSSLPVLANVQTGAASPRSHSTPQDVLREHRRRRDRVNTPAQVAAADIRQYASLRERVIAYALDALAIYLLVALVVAELSPQVEGGFGYSVNINEQALYAPLAVLLGWLYYALLESSRWQATFGKRWMGIRVADLGGRRIEFRRASLRYWGQYLSGALGGIGFLMAAFTPRRQALHDLLAGCVILRGRPQRAGMA